MKKIVLTCIIFITLVSCEKQKTIEIQPNSENAKDVVVFTSDKNANAIFDRIHLEAIKNETTDNESKILIGFNFPKNTKMSKVDSAFLYLNLYNDKSFSGENGFYVYKIEGDWDREVVNWNTIPKTSAEKVSVSQTSRYKPLKIELTKLLQNDKDVTKADFLLSFKKLNGNLQYISFKSSSNADAKDRPKLVIYGKE